HWHHGFEAHRTSLVAFLGCPPLRGRPSGRAHRTSLVAVPHYVSLRRQLLLRPDAASFTKLCSSPLTAPPFQGRSYAVVYWSDRIERNRVRSCRPTEVIMTFDTADHQALPIGDSGRQVAHTRKVTFPYDGSEIGRAPVGSADDATAAIDA